MGSQRCATFHKFFLPSLFIIKIIQFIFFMMRNFLLPALLAACFAANAQQPATNLTDKDYAKAESFLYYNTAPYIDHENVNPNWITGDRFWFRDMTAEGSRFLLVDPDHKKITPAFDSQKLAAALSQATVRTYTASMLPFFHFQYTDDGKAILFHAAGDDWKCDLKTYTCTATTKGQTPYQVNDDEAISPNGQLAAFIKDNNLWVRNLTTGKQTQLTTDGVQDFGYATDNASWRQSSAAILRWSPDSKKIATYKQDQRNVSDMYLVSTNVGAPHLEKWKYEFPMDTAQMKIYRVIINVDTPKVIFLKIPPDPRRSTNMDDITNDDHLADVQWNEDGSQLVFVSTSRFHQTEKIRMADAATGNVREIFEEKVPTQFESGHAGVNWRYLAKSNELIWFSERDNWGHLYLYDATTGQLKNKITDGNYVVDEVKKVDEKKRVIYFIAVGLQKENPYFAQLCKVNFDGEGFKILTPEPGTHAVTFSPSGNYFIDSYSKPDVPGETVLRNLDGKIILTLAKTDISRLKATGWKPPVPFQVTAADGKTAIYGLMYVPTQLDSLKKYPVIDYIYPGPQGGSVGGWSFRASRGDNQALAELGFVVVEIEGTGNPLRTKSFQDMSYGNMAINTLPDQITGIRQLAARYAYMDTSRVGIWGHSGGGFATAGAMFRYPDFFKVGIAESGNHDNRNYESDWGDRFDGPIDNDAYEAQANATYAKNLKGKLLLVHGLMDNNVPPQNTLLVVQALENAGKDFDLIVFPNSRHGYGSYTYYMMRRRWDYFVKNLLGAQPPQEYKLQPMMDPRNAVR